MRTTKVCGSVTDWMKPVRGKTGDYIVTHGVNEDPDRDSRFDFACTCPAFQYRKDRNAACKHIAAVELEFCGHGLTEDVTKVLTRVDELCPKCGTAMFEARMDPPAADDFDLDAQIAAVTKKSQEVAEQLGVSQPAVHATKKPTSEDMDDWF